MPRAFRFARRGAWLAAVLLAAAGLAVAHGNEQADARATIGRAHVVIHYGRPELNGRDPLKLIEPGQLWRMGADVPTTLKTDADLDFGGTRVVKGEYVLRARYIEPGRWTLVLERAPSPRYDPNDKAAEIPLTLEKGQPAAEQVTISLTAHGSKGEIEIRWGALALTGTFQAAR